MPKSNYIDGLWWCHQHGWNWASEKGLLDHLNGPYHSDELIIVDDLPSPDVKQKSGTIAVSGEIAQSIKNANIAIDKFDAMLKKVFIEDFKKGLNAPANYFTTKYSDKPHNSKGTLTPHQGGSPMATKTIEPTKLGAAKKQRDYLRNKFQADIAKFVEKFGGTPFEVAHAVADSVLSTVNTNAEQWDTVGLPNALAQTLLPDTQAMLAKAGKDVPEYGGKPSGLSSFLDEVAPPTTWSSPIGKSAGTPHPGKANKPYMPKPYLKDIDVYETDITAEIYYTSKSHKQTLETFKSLNEPGQKSDFYYVTGAAYVYGPQAAKYGLLTTGYSSVIIKLNKKRPYISAEMLKTFGPNAPKGMKWRKLKNKAIYKLNEDTKYKWPVVKTEFPQYVTDHSVNAPKFSEEAVTSNTTAVEVLKKNVFAVYGLYPEVKPQTTYVKCVASKTGVTANIFVWQYYGASVAEGYNLVPTGYTWLKNPLKMQVMLAHIPGSTIVPIAVALQIPAPKGFHWETLCTDLKKAILMVGDHGPTDGPCSFPPDWYQDPQAGQKHL